MESNFQYLEKNECSSVTWNLVGEAAVKGIFDAAAVKVSSPTYTDLEWSSG